MEKKRQATYTVQVPIQFTFVYDNDIDLDELYKRITVEAYKRLTDGNPQSGYFDVLEKDIEIVNTCVHKTREEIEQEDRAWRLFWAEARGLR